MADLGQYDPIFQAAGEEWNVDPRLLKAMATQESGGDARAQSGAGAQGLMQIIPSTQKALGVTDPHDPAQSIYGGAKYMAQALDAEKTPEDALRYYHGGPGWRGSYGPESRAYAPAVTAHYQRLAGAIVPRGTAMRTGGVDVARPGAPPASAVPTPAAPPASGTAPVAESHDDFLKRTAGGAEADAGNPADRHAAFLARTGAKDAPEKPASSLADYSGADTDAPASVPIPAVVGRIGGAIAEGFRSGTMQTPQAAADNQRTLVGKYLVNPLVEAGNLPFRALGAFGAGTGQAAYEAGNALDPALGRDMYMLNQVVQTLAPTMPATRLPRAGNALDMPRGPAQTAEVFPPRAEPMAPAPAFNLPGETRSVGAAASRDMSPPGTFDLTPAEVKANRRQAEMADINAPAQPGDNAVHVEGSYPTLAQRSGDPAVSQREVMLRQRNPNAFEGEGGILTEQNTARVRHYENVTPSDTQIQDFRTDRSRLAETDKAQIMQHAKPADLVPAAAHLDDLLADPRIAENPSVVAVLKPLRESLNGPDGALKSDPMAVWGMHDHVKNLIEKSKDQTSTERFAQAQLVDYKGVVDGVMNAATDNHFQTFLDHYAELSQKINAGELLNKFRQLRLTNQKGEIQANAFHKFVADLAYSRGKRGLDPAMDIPDETMRGLIAIDTDLKRAGQIDLGKARGSPSNLFGVLAKDMGIGLAHAGTVALTGGNVTGNILLQGAIQGGSNLLNRARLNTLTRKHLNPPPGGWQPPANYLTPP